MTIEITHNTQATGTDAGNGEIRKAQWNETHKILMATARLIGRVTSGAGSAEEIAIYNGLVMDANGLAIDKATDANVRAAASNKVFTTDLINSALSPVTLTDGTTVAVNWANFLTGNLTVAGNRTLGNPSNVQTGTSRIIRVVGNNATERSLVFAANYKGPLPEDTVTSTKGLLLSFYAHSATEIHVTWKAFEL